MILELKMKHTIDTFLAYIICLHAGTLCSQCTGPPAQTHFLPVALSRSTVCTRPRARYSQAQTVAMAAMLWVIK